MSSNGVIRPRSTVDNKVNMNKEVLQQKSDNNQSSLA